MSTKSTIHTPPPAPAVVARTPTPLAPWPATRLSDDHTADPYALPEPREGEEIPPVMITQDMSGTRTISTNYRPSDQAEVPPGPAIPPTTVPTTLTSGDILGLSTTPKVLVPAPAAGASLEFTGATGLLTYGTTPYVDAGGAAVLQIKCGTVVVSNDLPASAITGSASTSLAFTALPGIAPVVDQPLTLSISGGSLTGGDSVINLDVNHVVHEAPSADPMAVRDSGTQTPTHTGRSTVGTSLYSRKNR